MDKNMQEALRLLMWGGRLLCAVHDKTCGILTNEWPGKCTPCSHRSDVAAFVRGMSRRTPQSPKEQVCPEDVQEAIEELCGEMREMDKVGCDHDAGICNCHTTYAVKKVESWLRTLQSATPERETGGQNVD